MSTGQIRARVQDGVAVLRLDQPSMNILGDNLRVALSDALMHFAADEDVRAIALGARGDVFSAGTDVRGLDVASEAIGVAALCQQIENCAKPVVAAIRGAAFGAGAEIALAAHMRIASQGAKFGLPDIAIGLPPSAGGIQRLVRLVGPKVAMQMLSVGRTVDELVAQQIGLIDQVVSGDVCDAACEVAKATSDPIRTRDRRAHLVDGLAFMNEVERCRRAPKRSFVTQRMIDCVEAVAMVPFDAALGIEQGAWEACFDHPEGRALRHVFLAERTASPKLLQALEPTPEGKALAARLFAAQDQAIVSMMTSGITEREIDHALVGFGFAQGPFGGKDGQDAPQTETIQRRVVAAIMAEGARCLEQGLVRNSADLDAIAVRAMGFPRRRGGPMMAATQMGLVGLQCDMVAWAKQNAVWVLPELGRRAMLEARGFAAIGHG